jgi:hypothetical protein
MAKRHRDVSAAANEQAQSDARDVILVAPHVSVVDIAAGESEPLWVWELED